MSRPLANLIFSAILISTTALAGDVLPDFEKDSLPLLNEDLRKKDARLDDRDKWFSERAADAVSISVGVITATQSFHVVDTEAAAATDDLATINGAIGGRILVLYAASSARTVVAKDGTGNLKLEGDFTMDNTEDVLTLIADGNNWREITRANNGA